MLEKSAGRLLGPSGQRADVAGVGWLRGTKKHGRQAGDPALVRLHPDGKPSRLPVHCTRQKDVHTYACNSLAQLQFHIPNRVPRSG